MYHSDDGESILISRILASPALSSMLCLCRMMDSGKFAVRSNKYSGGSAHFSAIKLHVFSKFFFYNATKIRQDIGIKLPKQIEFVGFFSWQRKKNIGIEM